MTDPSIPDQAQTDATDPAVGRPLVDPRQRRPLIERLGLALVAVVVIGVFGALAAASYASGEPFLALMASVGALMTAWAGGLTLFRG